MSTASVISGVASSSQRRRPDPGDARADHNQLPLQPGGKDQLRDFAGCKGPRLSLMRTTVISALRGWSRIPGAEGETEGALP